MEGSTQLQVPTKIRPRNRCPFYGFYMGPNVLLDQEGNQCALISTSYAPCYMDLQEESPNWDKCRLNGGKAKALLEKLVSVKVFAKEFEEPLSFSDWKEYVMSPKVA